jgi:hypothetical protein
VLVGEREVAEASDWLRALPIGGLSMVERPDQILFGEA